MNQAVTPEIALLKAVEFALWLVPGCEVGSIAEVFDLIAHTGLEGSEFYDAFTQHMPPDDYGIIEVDYTNSVPPNTSVIPIWVGLRADVGACVFGRASAFSLGWVQEIKVSNVDPPVAPTVTASNQVVLGQPLVLSLISSNNQEDVSYWVDWDDGTQPQWTGFYAGGVPAILTNVYTNVGYYTILCKAKEWDEMVSLNPTYTEHTVQVIYPPLSLPDLVASDREFCDRIRVRWSAVTNAGYYLLYRDGSLLANTTDTSYDDIGVDYTEHTYTLKVCNSNQVPSDCGLSTNRATAVGRINRGPSGCPAVYVNSYTNLACDIGLMWPPVLSNAFGHAATHYYIYRSRLPDPNPNTANLVFNTTNAILLGVNTGTLNTNFNDVPPLKGWFTFYKYWVAASNECGITGPHECETNHSGVEWGYLRPLPLPVTNVLVATEGSNALKITWTDVGEDVFYYVLRDGFRISDVLEHTQRAFTNTDAQPGQTYQYAIQVCDKYGGCGCVQSASVAGSILQLPPPANVCASDELYHAKVRVEWDPVPGSQSYRVRRNTQNNSTNAALIATCSTSYYEDTNVDSQTTYYYWVEAGRSNCFSTPSVVTSGSANWAPAVTATRLQLTNRNAYVGDWLSVQVATSDADTNPVRPVYNWRVNGNPIAALLLPFESPGDSVTRDYSGNSNTGMVHGALWASREKLIHQCDSLVDWQALQGSLTLETNLFVEGRAAVCWETYTTFSRNKIELDVGGARIGSLMTKWSCGCASPTPCPGCMWMR